MEDIRLKSSSESGDGLLTTTEIVYRWPNGDEEVRYRRPRGSRQARLLIDEVESLRARLGAECPYFVRYV